MPPQPLSFPVLTRISDIRAPSEMDTGRGHGNHDSSLERLQGQTSGLISTGGLPVMVLEQAPGWNVQRMLGVLGLMGALTLAAAAWVVILRRQVLAKTAEIQEWLRREAALKNRYRDLLEDAIDMVYTRDLQGKFTSVNNTVLKILGYTRQELLRMNIADVVAPEYRESVRQAVDQGKEGEAVREAELEIITKYGARVAVEIRSRLLYEDGKAVGVQGIARNVAERQRVEQQVRLQAAALEAAALAIMITNPEHNIIWVNPAFTALSGYTLEEVIGKNPRLLAPGKPHSDFRGDIVSTIQSGRVWRGEVINRRKDGSLHHAELTITPVFGRAGEITHFVTTGQDISARKLEDEARAQLAAIVESSNDAILGITPQGTFASWNRGAEVLYGYRAEEVLGKPVSIIVPPDLVDEVSNVLEQVRQGKRITSFETVRVGKDGRRIAVSLSMSPLKNHRGEVVGGAAIAHDITERKQAEQALRRSEARLREALLAAQMGTWEWTVETDTATWDENLYRIAGRDPELPAPSFQAQTAIYAPESWERLKGAVENALASGTAYEVDLEMIRPDGSKRWVVGRGEALRDGRGHVTHLRGTVQDITGRKRTEEALRESEAGLAAAQRIASIGSFEWNVQTNTARWSDETFRIFGLTPGELEDHRQAFLELIHPADRTRVDHALTDALNGTREYDLDYRIQLADGTEKMVHAQAEVLKDEAGHPLGMRGINHDITERKRAEAALRDSEQRYQEFIARSIDAVWRIELDRVIPTNLSKREMVAQILQLGYVAEANDAMARQLGLSKAGEVIGKRLGELIRGLGEERLATFFSAADGNFQSRTLSFNATDAAGNPHYFLRTEMPVVQDGMLVRAWGITRDITKMRLAEEALKLSEERFRSLFENATVGIYRTTPAGQILVANPALVKMLGYKNLDDLVERNLEEQGFEPTYPRQLFQERMAREGEVKGWEVAWTRQDGSQIFVRESARTIRGEDNQILYYDGIVEDITERKRAEEALIEERNLLHTLMDNVPDVIYFKDRESRFTRINKAHAKLFGLSNPAQAVGKTDFDFFTDEHAQSTNADEQEIVRTGLPMLAMEEKETWPDGRVTWASTTKMPLRDAHGNIVGTFGVSRDITKSKLAEEKLQESEERFRQLAENVEEVLLLFDPHVNKVFYVSPAYEKVWGRSCESLYASPRSYLAGIHPDDRPLIAASLDVSDRTRGEWEYRVIRPNGTVRWMWDRAFPIRDASGKVVRIAELVQDITERKQVEAATRKAMDAAEEANRTKTEFLTNISHELRTPMNAVIGMTELALATNLNSEQRSYLELVETSADSLLELINHILDFSKIEAGKFELEATPFDLADVMEDALRPLAVQACHKGLEMACGLDPAIPSPLVGDPVRLKQMLVNLVENAIKFTDQGEVVIRVWVEAQKEADLTLHIAVADTGVGIPTDKVEMIFEAFRQVDGSLTRRFAGAGLGLAICSELVRMMGGSIWVDSGPGRGSTFHVNVHMGLAGSAVWPPDEGASNPLRNVPVLVVDDHAASREILADMLRHRAMLPTIVDGGEAALAAIRAAQNSASPFRLALFDAQMPGGDGFALAEQARRIPGFWAPILMLLPPMEVGRDAARCRELGIVDYCPKPVRESQLVKALVKALESSGAGSPPPAMSGSSQELGRTLRILLAESNEVSQVLATHLLEKRGHQVSIAADGGEVLTIIQDACGQDFDLVLMDMEMPGMNGLETARAIREIERKTGGRLPIIAMTALTSPSEEEACRAAGMQGYLAKPLQASALFEIIHRVVRLPEAAAPAEAPRPPVFDRYSFLTRLEGDELLAGEIIELFLQECPKLLEGVRQAAAQHNASLLERAAHAMKGSVGDIAAPQAFDAARTLEYLARDGKLDGADAAMMSLESSIQQLLGELQNCGKKTA
jgi:PAS domain S-box-containing protein